MHMADALVSPAVAGTMYAVSTAAAAYSVKEIKLEDLDRKVPAMGVMGAFVFATQMINFTIPGTGSSGHLCGGMLLSAILGPCGGFLTMIAILAIQCLLFADGGLLALGCNVWNMAFYGCFVGGFLIWRTVTGKKMTKGRITAASIIGCIAGLQLGAFSVTDIALRDYRAAFCCIFRNDAADPPGNRACGRVDHCGSTGVYL